MLISILSGGGSLQQKLVIIGLLLVGIIVSLSFHEWAHAHAAHRMGDDTAKNLGRMTLNPLAHIEPVGFLMLLIIGFGWAKPVPVNPRNYRKFRLGEFVVSFAGIFTNLVIAFITAGVIVGLQYAEYYALFTVPDLLYTFLIYLGMINCSLAVFNFIPIYPLDGYHIFELIFGRLLGPRVMEWLRRYGSFILYGLLIVSMILPFSPISTVADWIFDKFYGLFIWFFGLFIV